MSAEAAAQRPYHRKILCICEEAGIANELSVETFLETPLMKQKKSKKRTRILVLEPDEELASAIMSSLQEAAPDAQVEMTRSLEEAQQLALGVKPELFVLDVDAAPDLGQDFLYDLRTSHPNARAIILTGVHLPEQREQVAGLGAIHFLEKPLVQWDFVDLVEHLLRRAKDKTAKKRKFSLRKGRSVTRLLPVDKEWRRSMRLFAGRAERFPKLPTRLPARARSTWIGSTCSWKRSGASTKPRLRRRENRARRIQKSWWSTIA